MANWFRLDGTWFPISILPAKGPVVLTDETQTITWLSDDKPSAAAIDHSEHVRDVGTNQYQYEKGEPKMAMQKVKPAYWSPAVIVDG